MIRVVLFGADPTVANDLADVRAGRHALHLVRPGRDVETLPPGPDLAERLIVRARTCATEGRSGFPQPII